MHKDCMRHTGVKGIKQKENVFLVTAGILATGSRNETP